jgi:SH3-like domain-containing protein
MKILLVLTLLLANIAAACQNSDLTQTQETVKKSPTQNSTDRPAATTTNTPQASPKSEGQPSTPASKRVATIPNNITSSQQSCQIRAYVIDKDPQGLNVRSGPGNDSKIIDILPTNTIGVIVNLNASQGDWVQLSKAQSPGKIEFQGSGWVYSQLLGTSTRGYDTKSVAVYDSPSNQSTEIGRIPSARSTKLISCNQSWALVEYQGLKGWIAPDSQCPNPLSTCP